MRCTNGLGYTQSHGAEGWIVEPGGRRNTAMCRADATVVITEYAEKLGETWTFEEGATP